VFWIALAAGSGALAVAAGAYGAHGLRGRVTEGLLSSWITAADYHLLHSVVLLALGLYALSTRKSVALPGSLFALGILLFSGSIYGLVLAQQGWLAPLTPIGGLFLLGGWLAVLWLARSAS